MFKTLFNKFIAPIGSQILTAFGIVSAVLLYLARRDARIKEKAQLEGENETLKNLEAQNSADQENYHKIKHDMYSDDHGYITNSLHQANELRNKQGKSG